MRCKTWLWASPISAASDFQKIEPEFHMERELQVEVVQVYISSRSGTFRVVAFPEEFILSLERSGTEEAGVIESR